MLSTGISVLSSLRLLLSASVLILSTFFVIPVVVVSTGVSVVCATGVSGSMGGAQEMPAASSRGAWDSVRFS